MNNPRAVQANANAFAGWRCYGPEFKPPKLSPQTDLQRLAASPLSLSQIYSIFVLLSVQCNAMQCNALDRIYKKSELMLMRRATASV